MAKAANTGNPEPSTHSMVERARTGDPEAFGALYTRYNRRIFNLCLGMVKDSSLAEDMVQDAFLQAFRRIHTFRGDAQFSTWLHRIAVNAVLMYFRRCKTNPLHLVEGEKQQEELSEDQPLCERIDFEDVRLSHTTDRIELERAVLRLPPGYRIMFILHDVEGYEHAEIASLMGCTPGTTKSQLFKARRRLRALLAEGNAQELNLTQATAPPPHYRQDEAQAA